MITDEALVQLGQLNRRPLPGADTPACAASVVPPQNLQRSEPLSSSQLPDGVEIDNAWGRHYLIEGALDHIWPDAVQHVERGRARLQSTLQNGCPLHPEMRSFGQCFPQRTMFLDLETCGFAGSMIFLAGILHYQRGALWLSQLLARDYAEEKAMLQTLWRTAQANQVLVTFNGKSFDWPTVHDRSTVHHLGCDARAARPPRRASGGSLPGELLARGDPRPELTHCDLLHHCRRRWKKRLPNCRLQTLEQYICGRRRSGDIAGRDIPQAYHDYVRSRDAWQLRSILKHNALDLITLLQLSLCVAVRR